MDKWVLCLIPAVFQFGMAVMEFDHWLSGTSPSMFYWASYLACALGTTYAARSQYKKDLRLRRKANHQCEKCGYDLRASVERCPECGAGIPTVESGEKVVSK